MTWYRDKKILVISSHILQMGKIMMVIILWSMFFIGLIVRSFFPKKSCIPLRSHCLHSISRHFISHVSFNISACLELKLRWFIFGTCKHSWVDKNSTLTTAWHRLSFCILLLPILVSHYIWTAYGARSSNLVKINLFYLCG